MIRVVLPYHLKILAQVDAEVELNIEGEVTLGRVLDALESRYPVLCGTIRDHETQCRRPMVRFFACAEDISLEPPDSRLPAEIITGKESLLIVGAIAGG